MISIGVARGAMGAPAPPGRRKILGVIYTENLLVHYQRNKCTSRQIRSQF